MGPAQDDDRVIPGNGKKVREEFGFPDPDPAFRNQIRRKARGVRLPPFRSEDTAAGGFLCHLRDEPDIDVPEEELHLLLEARIVEADVTEERVPSDLNRMGLLPEVPKGIQETGMEIMGRKIEFRHIPRPASRLHRTS